MNAVGKSDTVTHIYATSIFISSFNTPIDMASSVLSKVDLKLVAAVTLILGLFVGFYVNNSLISEPKIALLTNQTLAQQDQIIDLETKINSLESEKNLLQTEYEEYEISAQQTIEEQDLQIDNFENQIQSKLDLIKDQQKDIEDLEILFDNLWNEYSDLQDRYNEVYNPLYTEFTTDLLDIRFTVNTDVYSDNNNPIQGTVELSYTDGRVFRGTYKINLYKVFVAAGSLSDPAEIIGVTTYKWNNPFALGPGSYRLTLSDIRDNQGELVVSNLELREHPIYIFMG